MEKENKPNFTAIALPAALLTSSACLLWLTMQSTSLSTLRGENEKESARQSELSAQVRNLRAQDEAARSELATQRAEQLKLAEEKKSATEIISRSTAAAAWAYLDIVDTNSGGFDV